MDYLLVSNIALWLLVGLLVLVNYALLRQVGVLYERIAPAGALAVNQNLRVGQEAPKLTLQTIDSRDVRIGGPSPDGRSQLLFFSSPDCPVCKTLLPALKSAAKAEADWISLVLASDGAEQDHPAHVRREGLGAFPYVVSQTLGMRYGVAKLPYAVLIDERGRIASMGIVNNREHIDSLFEAKDKNVASIQQYLRRQSSIDNEVAPSQ